MFEITKSEENAPGYCRSHGSRVKEEVRTGWIKPCVYKWGNCTLKQFEIAVCSSFGRMARADAVLTPWAPHLEQLSPDSCCTSVLSGTLCSHGQGHSTQPSLRNCLIPFLFLQKCYSPKNLICPLKLHPKNQEQIAAHRNPLSCLLLETTFSANTDLPRASHTEGAQRTCCLSLGDAVAAGWPCLLLPCATNRHHFHKSWAGYRKPRGSTTGMKWGLYDQNPN